MEALKKRLSAMNCERSRGRFTNSKLKAMTLAVLAMMALTPFSALPVVDAAPIINIYVDSQTLIAGAENTIVFTIANSGDSTAYDINATVTVPTNSMLLVDNDGSWNLTDLAIGQSTNITMKVYVTPSTAGSLVQMTVRVTYESITTRTETKTIGFSVATVDLNGAYLSPLFSPFDLNASQDNSVSLVIVNEGGRLATNISVSLGTPSSLGSGLQGLGSLTSLTGTSSLTSGSGQFLIYNLTGRWNFDSLPANGSLDIPLKIFVMPSAAGSISLFPVALTYTDGFTFTEVTRYAVVRVPSVPTSDINFKVGIDPQEFNSGGITHANVNITNMGQSELTALTVQLSLSGSFTGGSTSFTGSGISIPSSSASPFVLIGQDGSWYFDAVSAGESLIIPVDVFTSPSASGSVATVSVALSYTTPLDSTKQETKVIGLIIRGTVDIYVLGSSTFPSAITPGKTFSASVNIINLGSSSAQGLLVYPQSTDDLTAVSTASIFLGDVDVNIPTSLTLSYLAGNITNGTYSITIPYSYKDSLGEWMNGTLTVPLKLAVSSGTEKPSADGGSNGIVGILYSYWWLIVAVAVVSMALAYALFRRRKSGL